MAAAPKYSFERVAVQTLQEKVYESLRDLIMRNALLPGQRLSIDGLAMELGVSPTPVRDALTRLCADELVKRPRNKMALVAEITPEHVQEVYEARKLVEPYAVRLAAKGLSSNPELEHALRKVKQEAEQILKDPFDTSQIPIDQERYLEIDLRLAEIISEALGKTLLRKLFLLIGNHSLRIRSFAQAASNPCTNECTLLPKSISKSLTLCWTGILTEPRRQSGGTLRMQNNVPYGYAKNY